MAQKLEPGKQYKSYKNPRTGLEDLTEGDHSLKAFIKMQWDWTLIWLVFFIISVLEIINFQWVINSITESAYTDGFFAGLMVAVGLGMFIPALIGITLFLRDWWLKLCGEKDWNKKIFDSKN